MAKYVTWKKMSTSCVMFVAIFLALLSNAKRSHTMMYGGLYFRYSNKGSNISNKGNTKNMIFATICEYSNTSNMDNIELTVLCVDVVGRTDKLQFKCLEGCPTHNDLNVKQGRLTILNPLGKRLIPATDFCDNSVDVIFINVPDAPIHMVLRSGRHHNIKDKTSGLDKDFALLCHILPFSARDDSTVFRAVGVDHVGYLI